MVYDPFKLCDVMPEDVSDETAFVLYQFTRDLQQFIEITYSRQIKRYFLEAEEIRTSEYEKSNDPPF